MAALAGLLVVALGVASSRQPATDAATYLRELDTELGDEDADEYSKRLADPFISRALRPLVSRLLNAIGRLTPRNHVERIHQKLLVAGMSQSVRAEEFVTLQVVAAIGGILLTILFIVTIHPPASRGTLVTVLLVGAGVLGPFAWLNRKGGERQAAIFKDMPDVLDLLAISVEAGVGFEGALEVVCTNFDSALATEFSRTLKEMELGLSRKEALQNLKRRTNVPELSNFILAITQADSLGMPLGRVLHTQAAELRKKRRQWAREKAGKLPVKIMFPLVLFIFPAILVVILGPSADSVFKGLK
jgi:tight adherence protein C